MEYKEKGSDAPDFPPFLIFSGSTHAVDVVPQITIDTVLAPCKVMTASTIAFLLDTASQNHPGFRCVSATRLEPEPGSHPMPEYR